MDEELWQAINRLRTAKWTIPLSDSLEVVANKLSRIAQDHRIYYDDEYYDDESEDIKYKRIEDEMYDKYTPGEMDEAFGRTWDEKDLDEEDDEDWSGEERDKTRGPDKGYDEDELDYGEPEEEEFDAVGRAIDDVASSIEETVNVLRQGNNYQLTRTELCETVFIPLRDSCLFYLDRVRDEREVFDVFKALIEISSQRCGHRPTGKTARMLSRVAQELSRNSLDDAISVLSRPLMLPAGDRYGSKDGNELFRVLYNAFDDVIGQVRRALKLPVVQRETQYGWHYPSREELFGGLSEDQRDAFGRWLSFNEEDVYQEQYDVYSLDKLDLRYILEKVEMILEAVYNALNSDPRTRSIANGYVQKLVNAIRTGLSSLGNI